MMSTTRTTTTMATTSTVLEYEGCNMLRARLVLSTLSGRPVRITRIRDKEEDVGLKEFEASFVRLLDKLSNGCRIEVNATGTTLKYHPGVLMGGRIEHECSPQRNVGYYLEPLMMLALFSKSALHVTLRGVTNGSVTVEDPSPDMLKLSLMPVLKRYTIVDDGLELRVDRRGAAPNGGGQITLKCPVRRSLKAMQVVDQGKVKRVRGLAWATRVSPSLVNRVVESAKGVMLNFLPDVYINTDHSTGARSGKSPGYGLVLVAETTTGVHFCSEMASFKSDTQQTILPEDLGVQVGHKLCEEIYRGGCVDSTAQNLSLLLMALGPRDVSKIILGPLSEHTVLFLRLLRDFFGITFKLETQRDDEDDDNELAMGANKVNAVCVGIGYSNINKKTS